MKLNIVNPDAGMLHLSLGITEERSDEICEFLDSIMQDAKDSGEPVKLCECLQKIARICITTEELVFAVFTNARWLEMNDVVL